jgi:mono/diheme cytochrome c family protein
MLLLIAAIPFGLMATGTIDSTSLRMVLNVMTGMAGPAVDVEEVDQRYSVPEGFTLRVYAQDLSRARFLRFTPAGDLLVSRPQGLDIAGGWLFIAESNRISRIKLNSDAGVVKGELQPLVEGLSDNGNHWSKTIRIGPDGMLYLAQGSTCNICDEQDPRRNTMMRFQLDGSDGEIIANGLRNSVGFDWAPWNGAIYATDNGRDMMGDDFPPCELNRIEQGRFYGWPYFNGDNVPDPDMGPDPLADQRQPTAPVHGFRAHNAPLGMSFVDGSNMPGDFSKAALVALHGSWNRSEPDGYKVVSLHWTGDVIEERDFLSGFNLDGDISGRPVDVAQGPDGAIYVSDDYAGAIYRISYEGLGASAGGAMPLEPESRLDSTPPAWLAEVDLEAMASRGAELYNQYDCRSCHELGENPVDLNRLSERLGYTAVINTLEAPQSPMPVFPLEEDDKRALAVYLLASP